MALNFPDSPTVGQIFSGYTWDGEKWTPPSSAGMVRYDIAQSFTYLQQAQARANIGDLKKNYIVNGAMMVSQENGTTAGTTNSYYPVDQFDVGGVSDGAYSTAQVVSTTPGGSPNRLRVTVTTADTSLAASQGHYIRQRIEGLRVADLLGGTANAKTFIVQFGVKAPAGTYCVGIWNSAANRRYIAEYTIAAGEANTDVVKSVVIPGDVTGTWAKDNTAGMYVYWSMAAGSQYQGTAGAWAAIVSNDMATSNQFNLFGTNSNVFELFDVGLYEGNAAPAFQVPDYVNELLTCRRYYSKLGGEGTADIAVQGFANTIAQVVTTTLLFPTPMRIIPVVATVGTAFSMSNTDAAHVFFYPSKTTLGIQVAATVASSVSWFSVAGAFLQLNARM